MRGRTVRTDKRRDAILKALRMGHGYAQAAHMVGIGKNTLIEWRAADPAFRQACEEATEIIADIAEHGLLQRGLKGGDTLALLGWLRAHRPEKYHRRMLIAEETIVATPGATVEHRSIEIDGVAAEVVNNVHFRLPFIDRRQPEVIEDADRADDETEAA
jgi:hypothetical protein